MSNDIDRAVEAAKRRNTKPATFFAAIDSKEEVHGMTFEAWLAEAKRLFMERFEERYAYEALHCFYPAKGIDHIVDAWWVAGLTPLGYVMERLHAVRGK